MKIFIRLVRSNYLFFILVFFIPVLLVSSLDYLFTINSEASDNYVVNNLLKYPIIIYFLVTVIFVPFVETVFFQGFVIELVRFKTKNKWKFCLSIFISTLLFGISHSYSLYYVVACTLSGFFYALAYYLCIYRKQSPLLTVTIIHGMLNLAAFIDMFYI